MKRGCKILKKMSVIGVLVGVFATAVTGCSNKQDNQKYENTVLNIENVAEEVLAKVSYAEQLEVIDSDMMESIYTETDVGLIEKVVIYYNSAGTCDQLAVFQTVSVENANKVKESLKKDLENQIEANRDYLPDEIPKLQDPYLEVIGKYVVLSVSADKSQVKTVIDDILEKES